MKKTKEKTTLLVVPLERWVSPQPCPFCGATPEQYTIGARPNFGEKGQEMVRCKTGSCGLWGQPMSLFKWQKRANVYSAI